LQAIQNEIRAGAGEDRRLANMADALKSSLPPAFNRMIEVFKPLGAQGIWQIEFGGGQEIEKALTQAEAIHSEATLHLFHGAILVRQRKFLLAEQQLNKAVAAPSLVPGVQTLARKLAAVAAYVQFQTTHREKKSDVLRAVSYLHQLPREQLFDPRFVEVFLLLANEAGDSAMTRLIAAEMALRVPNDLKWTRHLMNLEYSEKHLFVAADLADKILMSNPNDEEASFFKARLLLPALKREQERVRRNTPVRAPKPRRMK
jgi:hypothetical protein